MKLIILVNEVAKESSDYTTTQIAFAAVRRGHEVWYAGIDGFVYEGSGRLRARACRAPQGRRSTARFLEELCAADTEEVDLDSGDVLLLRNNPADDALSRPWAQTVGLMFGAAAKKQGLLVLSDPDGLAEAATKLYVQYLPEEIRPATLIARDVDTLRSFVEEHGAAVIKPIAGSGGRGVFVLPQASEPNFNVMVEAVLQTGYVVAQEYLPEAADGDVRLFMLNGRILEVDGKIAAIHRKPLLGDPRSNMSAGAKAAHAIIDERIREIAELVRPKLIEDGMFLVGLDIAGGKVMEVNVFSPGGITSAAAIENVDFASAIVEAIEEKLAAVERYDHRFDNRVVATL